MKFTSPHTLDCFLKIVLITFFLLTIDLPVYLCVLLSLYEANDCLKSFTESNCLDISPCTLKGDKV